LSEVAGTDSRGHSASQTSEINTRAFDAYVDQMLRMPPTSFINFQRNRYNVPTESTNQLERALLSGISQRHCRRPQVARHEHGFEQIARLAPTSDLSGINECR
jgi:hypothetical protein